MLLAITVKQIPAFSRYYSPLFPGMAMLSGVLIAVLLRHRRPLFRTVGAICAAFLLVGAAGTFHNVWRVAERSRQTTEDDLPVQRLVASIDDDRGVIGARAHQLVFGVTTDIPTWGDQYLTEDEYVTYLTWPSDEEVLDLLARHDIGWVVIHNNHLLETKYNDVWLQPFHGRNAHYLEAVAASSNFCPWFEENLYRLYKVGPCEPATDPAG
jgi:hypothetical protein